MKVMLKPHVWRPQGDQPLTGSDRAAWFQEYTAFIEHYARLTRRIHADILCIGVEFGPFTESEAQWRTIIAKRSSSPFASGTRSTTSASTTTTRFPMTTRPARS
jgi:hypothetical protein